MTSIVLLSSSPARVFARSLTPVDLTSDLPSPGATLARKTTPYRDNDHATRTRDSFTSKFTSARQVLELKSSAENVPFKSPAFKGATLTTSADNVSQTRNVLMEDTTSNTHQNSPELAPVATEPTPVVVKIQASDLRKNGRNAVRSAETKVPRAVPRRSDWTPPRFATEWVDNPQDRAVATFGSKLLESFGNTESTSFESATGSDGSLTKRRKISLAAALPTLKPANSDVSTIKRRAKSPTKKNLTITGLVTGVFDDSANGQVNPMLSYLVQTQAKAEHGPARVETRTKSIKGPSTKRKPSGNSRLKSPSTAQKTFEMQELVFASASQLARDESPTLMKDTIDAIRQSQVDLLSSPLRTQHSARISPLPKAVGVSKYRARKSLWQSDQRDEENALFHVNELDDSKLFQNAPQVSAADTNINNALARSYMAATQFPADSDSPSKTPQTNTVIDIESLVSPPIVCSTAIKSVPSRKPFSTCTRSASSEAAGAKMSELLSPVSVLHHNEEIPFSAQNQQVDDEATAKAKIPLKPDYTTWSDGDLKIQAKAYELKRLRKRENLIAALEDYWRREHGNNKSIPVGSAPPRLEPQESLQHADVLGQVFGIQARPQPKVKKKPRPKKAPEGLDEEKPKRKRRAKAQVEVDRHAVAETHGPETTMIDVDDPSITAVDRLNALIFVEDQDDLPPSTLPASTAPIKGTGVKARFTTTKSTSKSKSKLNTTSSTRILTPAPTQPTHASSPGFDDLTSIDEPLITTRPSTHPPLNDLKSHIPSTLLHSTASKSTTHNSQLSPTYHEKILLYDPIILEDFTTWLNTIGFNGIGIDDEIGILEVRSWCESNGVTCLWKGGWRGNQGREAVERDKKRVREKLKGTVIAEEDGEQSRSESAEGSGDDGGAKIKEKQKGKGRAKGSASKSKSQSKKKKEIET